MFPPHIAGMLFSSREDIAELHQGIESLSSWEASAAGGGSSVCVPPVSLIYKRQSCCVVLAFICGA